MVIGSRFIEKEGFQSSGLRRVGIRYFPPDPSGDRGESDRSHIRHADGEPGCHEDLCGELSERLSGTGECGGDSSEKEEVTELPVIMREREEGTSSIAGPKSAYYMIKVTLAIFMEILRR